MGSETGAAGTQVLRKRATGENYPPAAVDVMRLTGDQERVLLEHLPIVRFLARRIHERLPQHVDIEDLVSAGVVGLMDAFAKLIPPRKCSSAATRSSVSGRDPGQPANPGLEPARAEAQGPCGRGSHPGV